MTVEEIVRRAFPGVTLYVLLVTFAIAAFRFARELRTSEERIYQEFLERLRSIRETFQRRYLEPIVAKVLDDSVEAARSNAVETIKAGLQAAAYPSGEDAVTTILDQSQATLAAQTAPGQAFLTSQDGTAFMEQLDRRQEQKYRMTASYEDLKRRTRNGYFSFFALSVILLLGLLSLILEVHLYVVITYVNIAVLVLLFGVFSVARMFQAENALRNAFEQLTLYVEEFE